MSEQVEMGSPTTSRDRQPHGEVRVKICGITSVADARAVIEAGADALGLNFHAASKRHVDVERAAAIVAVVPAGVWRVGVFVDASREEIVSLVAGLDLTAIQLHGNEPAGFERGWPVPSIRAVRIRSAANVAEALAAYAPDYFLCEGNAGGSYGGAGESFDWRLAAAVPKRRLIVAGGLHPENVADAVRALRPFAVDVASGVERSPGVKDAARVAAFIANAKRAA